MRRCDAASGMVGSRVPYDLRAPITPTVHATAARRNRASDLGARAWATIRPIILTVKRRGRILATIDCREVRLTAESTDIIQGTLDMLSLEPLSLKLMHRFSGMRPLEG